MKNVGQMIQTLANVGVVAGIVFLGIEVAQNNEYAATEIRATRYLIALEAFTIGAQNTQLGAVLLKDQHHETLTELEAAQLRSWWIRVFLTNQWAHSEMAVADTVPFIEMQRGNNQRHPAYRQTWEARRSYFEPDFIQFMEENVFNH